MLCAFQGQDPLKTRLAPQLLPVFAAVSTTNELVRFGLVPRRRCETVEDAERRGRQQARVVVSREQLGRAETKVLLIMRRNPFNYLDRFPLQLKEPGPAMLY